MAFHEINRSMPASNNLLELKSVLVRGLAVSEQLQREAAEITEEQIQSHYGVSGLTLAQWTATINGVVTALEATAVENYISQLG